MSMLEKQFESQYPETARGKEITQIISYVKEGSSCQLLGIAGCGRSTLLSILEHNVAVRRKHLGSANSQFHFVSANFSEVRNRPLLDVMKFLFLTLTESLRERKMFAENKAVGDIFREHLKFHDELVLFQGFKEAIDYLCLERKITVVFLFDRFEEYIPTVSAEFFTNLRVLRNRAKYKFSVVFSLTRPLEAILEPSLLADFYEFVAGHFVYVSLLDPTVTDFRIAYIEKITGKKLSPSVKKEILALTGGIAKLTKLAVEACLAHNRRESTALSTFLLQQKTIQGALLEIWQGLSPAEQADLRSGDVDESDTSSYLSSVGLTNGEQIKIPLLKTFIQAQSIVVQQAHVAIVYDEHTNTIKKGETILSDQLTASEFRLLAFLLQNNERVVEREELISVVWAENKSTAGITDQAVDQLVFRLRRKIEEDANNPKHIVTVKGRGFKFVE